MPNKWANRRIIIRLQTFRSNISVINMHVKSLNEKPEVLKQHTMCQLWCIQLIMHSTGAPDVVTGVVGHVITLSCPPFNNGTAIRGDIISVKERFRGPAYNPKSTVARLVIKRDSVVNDFKADADEKMRIDSKDGDLIIQNLTLGVRGFTLADLQDRKPKPSNLMSSLVCLMACL